MHADHLGSPVAATDQSGAILWAEQFSPYGESIPGSAANPDDEGFTGHIQDTGTGLTYMQARDYDPVIGRFLSNDPVGFAEGGVQYFNRYAYTVNDPVNNIDPTGNYRCANEDCSMANIERNPSQEGIPPISSEIEGAGNFDLGATITHQRHQTSKPGSSRRMKITRTPDLTIALSIGTATKESLIIRMIRCDFIVDLRLWYVGLP